MKSKKIKVWNTGHDFHSCGGSWPDLVQVFIKISVTV